MAGMPSTLEQYLASPKSPFLSKRNQQRLARLLWLCEALPECSTRPWGEGHIVIAVRKKTFAYYLNNHHDDGLIVLCCKSTLTRQRKLIAEDPDRFRIPAYLGPSGWVSLRLDLPRIDWKEANRLLIDACILQAPKSLAARITT
jgi:hypothetical protein